MTDLGTFLEAHADEDGNIPDEIMSRALDGDFGDDSDPEKEIDPTEEKGAEPEPEKKPEEDPAPEKEQQPEPDQKPKVMAKDGEHTIPYEEYDSYRNLSKEQGEKIALLEAQLAESGKSTAKEAEDGQGKSEEGAAAQEQEEMQSVLSSLSEEELDQLRQDFPEVVKAFELQQEALSKINGRLKDVTEYVSKQQAEKEKTDAETAEKKIWDDHVAAITAKHKDFQQIVDSGRLKAWVETQPSYVKNAYTNGTTQEVIELVSAFKEAAKSKIQPLSKDSTKQGKEQDDDVLPESLSDIPGAGDNAAASEIEKLASMSEAQLQDYLYSLPEDQRKALVARFI